MTLYTYTFSFNYFNSYNSNYYTLATVNIYLQQQLLITGTANLKGQSHRTIESTFLAWMISNMSEDSKIYLNWEKINTLCGKSIFYAFSKLQNFSGEFLRQKNRSGKSFFLLINELAYLMFEMLFLARYTVKTVTWYTVKTDDSFNTVTCEDK